MIAECITCIFKNIAGIFLTVIFLNKLSVYNLKLKIPELCISSAGILTLAILPYFLLDRETASEIADFSTLFSFILIPYFILQRKKTLTFGLCGLVLNAVLDLFNETVNYIFHIESVLISNIVFLVIAVIFSCILLAVISQSRSDLSVDILENVPVIIYIVIFISTLSTYYTMMLPKDAEFSRLNSDVFLMISAALVIICMVYIISKYVSLIQAQKISQIQIDSQLSQYEELLNKIREIKKFRHDYKNNMYALSSLINDGRVDDAREFIAGMNNTIASTEITFATGNYLADAIISHKATVAGQHDLTIKFRGTIPSVGITNNDLCTILSNALDNAIEGSIKCSPCEIIIEAIETDGGFMVTISNPVSKPVMIKNNRIPSNKKTKKNHGFGIENIESAVEKYNGFVKFDCDNQIFTIKIGFVF